MSYVSDIRMRHDINNDRVCFHGKTDNAHAEFHNEIQRIIDAEIARLRALLKEALPYVEHHTAETNLAKRIREELK